MKYLILADNQDITSAGIKFLAYSTVKNIPALFELNEKSKLISLLSEYPDAAVVLDYTLFDFTSPNEILILYERYPNSSWMLFSDELNDTFLRFIVANDLPFSIVLKSSSSDQIKNGIKAIMSADCYICPRVENHMKTLNKTLNDSIDHSLTLTEKEILKEVALGKTTKEIAFERNLSVHTIITHRKNIFRKLEVNNVYEATKYAIRAGIIDVSEYYI